MADTSQIVRQWQLLKMLGARRLGMTVREMSDDMHVSQKTIRRDLQLFQQLGFPIQEQNSDHGRKHWRLNKDWMEPQNHFTFEEALALYMARRFLQPLAGTPFWRAAQNAFRKIRSSFSESVIAYLDKMADTLHHTSTGAGDYRNKEELIDQLMIGIEDCRTVFITYQSQRATEPVTYDLYPFGITVHFGSLYLIGHKPDDDEIRTWKIDRIEHAEVTQVHFQRPADFNLVAYFTGSFGIYQGNGQQHIKIRFAPPVVRYVQESNWHASQQLTPQNDGSLIAEFQLSGIEEIKSWVLSFVSFRQACMTHFDGGAIVAGLSFLEDRHEWTKASRYSYAACTWSGSL